MSNDVLSAGDRPSRRALTRSAWRFTAILAACSAASVLYLYHQASKPWDIVFRTSVEWVGDQLERAPRVQEWHLAIPSEFVVRKDRYGTGVYDPARIGHDVGYRFVWLLSRVDANDRVVPYAGSKDRNEQFVLHLGNNLVVPALAQQDYCIDEDEHDRLRGGYGCEAHQKNCTVYMNFHGWPVEVSVDKERRYKDPQKVCAITRKLLATWTTKIDDLRHRASD